jgi:predicted small integral membrane protein
MSIRNLKIALVGWVSLMALIYALDNIVNLSEAHFAVATILSMTDHVIYPHSLIPPLTSPALAWVALLVILTGEFSVGILAGLGALRLWKVRLASAKDFNAAKATALVGCGMALVVWFGIFGVIGGALFQMWQTGVGANSLNGAFQYSAWPGLILIFLNMDDR